MIATSRPVALFVVEKARPAVPADGGEPGRGRPPKYPFASMEIGDSFRAGPEDRACVQRAASMYGLRTGKVFPTRRQKDGGVVCWRVA